MPSRERDQPSPREALSAKRRATLAGALTVFARDGYARAGIDTIAAEARVSTRTLYNHFGGKAGLFQEVIRDSATRYAEAQIGIIDRHLREVTDLQRDLADFAHALLAPMPGHSAHEALVRQISAEAEHLPQAAVEDWWRSGPARFHHELAGRFRAFAGQGLLRTADPERAAEHFALLVSGGTPPFRRAGGPAEAGSAESVAAGVHAFLYGYAG
ncbi:TetR/AcrR family transcriptional regulator [Streptomyces monticola]|uniref:TetR/AcrR family transcriptional regulator n=1 Tax=Streptomyces monticola TaxID=2666263 RepID=A0ABW2JFL1_9ACTN